MAELEMIDCCDPPTQSTCCASEAKDECCGHGPGCECSDGQWPLRRFSSTIPKLSTGAGRNPSGARSTSTFHKTGLTGMA